MPDGDDTASVQPVVKVLGGIGEVAAEVWDACAG